MNGPSNTLDPPLPLANALAQLSVSNVAKRFGGVTAVRDISLDLRKGQILSIIGPNGAAKTSLLKSPGPPGRVSV
jgi:ABC-type uncharacterized transport system ATPase subunit